MRIRQLALCCASRWSATKHYVNLGQTFGILHLSLYTWSRMGTLHLDLISAMGE